MSGLVDVYWVLQSNKSILCQITVKWWARKSLTCKMQLKMHLRLDYYQMFVELDVHFVKWG